MCVTMVIIYSKTLEKKKGVDDVTPRKSHSELTMNRGTALFSFASVEADRWRDLGRRCGLQQDERSPNLENLWGTLPEVRPRSPFWARESDPTNIPITDLIRDLSLSDVKAAYSPSAAPPSKRQCRSHSLSAWRPQGSRVWTPVEKRRCHSGGSAQRSSAGLPRDSPTMQRSSSFSLPARSNGLPSALDFSCFSFAGLQEPPKALSPSRELIIPAEPRYTSASCSPESMPELGRRLGPGGLSRSRSQPCVLNDKKISMKRRRPGEGKESRPSLDLTKMTQKLSLRNFQSLSWPGISGADSCLSSEVPPSYSNTDLCGTDLTPVCGLKANPEQKNGGGGGSTDDFSNEALDSDSVTSEDLTDNAKESDAERDVSQLGGELDIEQIERN
ncbi:protein FAM53B-like isoform X1 [Brienomyrus brachyistius]|uniref:protein FAM53B-like isoform X1 n=1 Tax=Brienomyrus brachyistius TaxID=42636 RepID=UPI0020B250F9|nr:protein FAM53B-like isoform X1 [Brienomyrus brachyistius]XP_048865358.1 protein FAM53B-like isoform X1 [Brienomyrus brachyistius]XP_048865360.1 protein FAM53B-like isoform X1 [Brienomyrus brachyistius]XP_048865361.1 protein FAM53B-like isoform X1 [Brienomyrus brachyistius]